MTRNITDVRNIGIMAHVDAGKTTLTERVLFNAGRIHKMGDVHDGNTVMDSRAIEQRHGITISAAATSCTWTARAFGNPGHITIIDTPGHVDFTIEVERSLRVLDGAVAVFSAVAGVEPQSETVWRQADRFGVPRICFVNKMDQVGADFSGCVGMLQTQLGAEPLVVQLPIGGGNEFRGVVDLVSMRATIWPAGSATPVEGDIPDAMQADARTARASMLESIVELDDAVLEKWLEDEHALSENEIRHLIRIGTVSGRLQPVLCGSAYRNIGVQPLLDAIVDFCPSPADRPPVEGINPRTGAAEVRPALAGAPLCALVSKVQSSRYGALSFVRVYSGRMRRGMSLINAATAKTERIGRLLRMHADEETEIDEAVAGDVIAIVGLKSTFAGETLSDPAAPILLGGFHCPDPVIEAVIEPKSSADHERLGQALATLSREDPSLRVAVDPETGETLLSGMGELHLTIVVETLKEEYNVEATIGPPRVAYREAVTQRAEIDHTHRKQNGGVGQYARVKLVLDPVAADATSLLFEDRSVGGTVPKPFVSAIEKALLEAMQTGPLAGYPVVGLKVTLIDGGTHAKDSSALAFELATRDAFKIAFAKAAPALLEPIMRVVVTTPADYLGSVIGDLQSRRGAVVASDMKAGAHEVVAHVPLANMFNYASAVRSLSQGRATFSMQLAHYAAAPKAMQAKMLAEAA